jgi:predicted rRNA methylase YqxC with S4 and FtsJ domains
MTRCFHHKFVTNADTKWRRQSESTCVTVLAKLKTLIKTEAPAVEIVSPQLEAKRPRRQKAGHPPLPLQPSISPLPPPRHPY